MIHLIDSDSIAYAAAATALDPVQARYNVNTILDNTFAKLNVDQYKLYVTGKNNFRYSIYPEYKATRLKAPRPEFLKDAMDQLITEWKADVSDGCEADDRTPRSAARRRWRA